MKTRIIYLLRTANRSAWLLWVFVLLGLSQKGYSTNFDFRNFINGLGQPFVYTIVQDETGHLWVGTGNGLSVFDGFDFRTFTINDSLAENFITSSFTDGSSIWFGHMNGRVTHYNGSKFQPVDGIDLKSSITAIEQSPDGSIWVSSFSNGIARVEPINNIQRDSLDNLQIPIVSFKFLSNSQLLIGSTNGLYQCKINDLGELEIIRALSEIPTDRIAAIINDRNGSGFFIATESNGLYSVKQLEAGFAVQPIAPDIKLNRVQDLMEDSNSNFWVSTLSEGLILIEKSLNGDYNRVQRFNESTGFSTDYVRTVFQDREGNIWSGNYGAGLTQLVVNPFSLIALNQSLYGTTVLSLANHKNTLWVGTDKGLLKMNQSSHEVQAFYSYPNGLPNDAITALYVSSDSELWVGTKANGLFRMDVEREKFVPIKISTGILENSITVITGSENQVWVGTKKGVCNVDMLSSESQWYNLKDGLPHNSVNHIFVDSRGRVWISTLSNTLTSIYKDKIEAIKITPVNGVVILGPIAEDAESTIWVGTYGSGIFRINSDSIANITVNDGLLSNYCYSLVADSNNNLWAGHRGGISRIRATDFFVKPYQEYASISSNCIFYENSIARDSLGTVWFGSNHGIWKYNQSADSIVTIPPALKITSISINNEQVELKNNHIDLPPGRYKVQIDFLGVNLKEPSLITYQFQLVGYDSEPEITRNKTITYPRLDPGKYTFKLWASTGDGVFTSSPLTIDIVISKPIWQQLWFYLLSTIAILGTIVLYINRRDYRHKRERIILEQKVKDRTNQLAKKNTVLKEKQLLIEKQNEELLLYRAHLEELVDKRTRELLIAKDKAEESDRLKTAFLDNMSHEIRTPMNGILGFISLLGHEGVDEQSKASYMDIINKSGQRLLNTINDIIEISKIESKQVVVNLSVVNIRELMDYYLKFYSQQTNEKGISIRITQQVQSNEAIIETDKNIIDHILSNLINNAVKFTTKGQIEFGNYIDENSIVFYVKDTGIGIPDDRIKAIFDRFVQADVSNTRGHEGSGLGLSIAKAYVELLDGKIWLESEIGKGSTFSFSIPYKPVVEISIPIVKKNKPTLTFNGNLTILIAEDDDNSFLYLKNVLIGITSTIVRATNGEEAVNLFIENPNITLILMDIKMPIMNGLDAVRRIREFNTSVPIIAQTAFALAGDKEKFIEAGCNDYISKPINQKNLVQLLHKYTQVNS